jgi:lysyl endopeptidase
MMKTGYPQIRILLLVMLASASCVLNGQVQFPGKPLGINTHLKASEVMYVLPPVDPLEIEAEMELNRISDSKPLRYAVVRPVNLSPESHGSWRTVGDQRVWWIHIISPEARSIGLIFGEYALLPGVKLFVYDPEQEQVKGAFTSGNNKLSGVFPIGHIKGDELVVEMQVPDGMDSYGELELTSLSHAFLNTGFKSSSADCPVGQFGCSGSCEIDINCIEGQPWADVKSSVVRIMSSIFYCTGVLINNTAYDGTPYILTAKHCLNLQEDVESSVFQFNYESPSCFGVDGPQDMSVSSGDLITFGDSIDFSLVRLSSKPPGSYGAVYAGWDRHAFQTGGSATIHHPYGDVKKISFDFDIPSIPAQQDDVPYPGLQPFHYDSFWWIRQWDVGSTEGGSSGAPLFNQAHLVIGVLNGGVAACGDSIGYDSQTGRVIYDPSPSYDDYFARFDKAWDYEEGKGKALKPWLDPVQSGSETLEGYLPNSTEPLTAAVGDQFRIYPNPTRELFHIESIKPLQGTGYYTVINLSGAVVDRGILDGAGHAEVPTTAMSPGLYIISVGAGEHLEHHKLLISGR